MHALRTAQTCVSVLLVLCTAAQQPKGTIGAQTGGFGSGTSDRPLLFSDMARLAPGSQLLPLAAGMNNYGTGQYFNYGNTIALEVGLFPFRKEERTGPELRLGVLSMGETNLNDFYQRHTRTPIDTLVSPTTGHTLILDSVFYQSVSVQHAYQRLGVSGALHWSTKGRWALSAGIGVSAGILFNSRTTISYSEGSSGNYWSPYPNNYDQNSRIEHFTNGSGWWAGIHAPLGVSFALGREDPLLSRIRLGYEVNWHLMHEQHAALGSNIRTFSRHMLGLRYTF